MSRIGTVSKNSSLLRLTYEVKKNDGTSINKEMIVRDTNRILLWILAIFGILIFAGFTIFKINLNIFLN